MKVDLIMLNVMSNWFILKEAVCRISHIGREEGSENCTDVLISKETTPKISAPLTNIQEW